MFVRVYFVVRYCSGIQTACCGFLHYEKTDGFGRERTRDLGFQRPARKPPDHRSRLVSIKQEAGRAQESVWMLLQKINILKAYLDQKFLGRLANGGHYTNSAIAHINILYVPIGGCM
jgi:hypothetical protein